MLCFNTQAFSSLEWYCFMYLQTAKLSCSFVCINSKWYYLAWMVPSKTYHHYLWSQHIILCTISSLEIKYNRKKFINWGPLLHVQLYISVSVCVCGFLLWKISRHSFWSDRKEHKIAFLPAVRFSSISLCFFLGTIFLFVVFFFILCVWIISAICRPTIATKTTLE